MRWTELLASPTGVEPVRAAGLFGALAGGISLVEPYWTGLAEALAAVAALGWAVRRPRDLPGRRGWVLGAVAVTAALVGLFAPAPWSMGRGVLFGGCAAMFAWDRRGAVPIVGEDG